MSMKSDPIKWLVWIYGAAMVPSPQIIMGDDAGPLKNEYTKTHFIRQVRIENGHYKLSLDQLLSYPAYSLNGDLLNDRIAKPKNSEGPPSAS